MNAALDYVSPKQAAWICCVKPATVRQWAARGLLRSIKTPGGHRRFLRSEVEAFRSVGYSTPTGPIDRRKLRPVERAHWLSPDEQMPIDDRTVLIVCPHEQHAWIGYHGVDGWRELGGAVVTVAWWAEVLKGPQR